MSHPDQDCERSLNASLRPNDDVTQGQRNRVIDQFIHGFSTWDWLYLRARVRQATLEDHHLASITDLPAEVLGLVAAYLTLPEFLRCQSLSRRWKTMWSDPVILGGICERYYPGALRFYEHNVPVDQLLPYLIRISAQPAGKGWKASAVTWNIGPEASSSRSREGIVTDKLPTGTDTSAQLFYAAGKVAWQSDPSFVVVDDLKENTWERISFLAGRLRGVITKLVAFSGDLLVVGHPDKAIVDQGSRASCRKIIVHHMSSKSQKFITLPNNLTHCVARGNRIICFTRGPQAFSLCWGGHLMELDMTIDEELEPRANERRIEDSVLFHPTQPETFFLVTIFARDGEQESARRVRPRGRLSRVQCSITATKFHDVTVIDRQRKPLEDVRYATSVYASNSRGLYALCFDYTNRTLAPHGNSVMFNTVTGQFATVRFSSQPRGYKLNEYYDAHYGQPILRLWNNHILLYYRADPVPPRLDYTGDTKPKASMILEAANCSRDRFGRSPPTDMLYQDSPFDGLSQYGRFLGMQKSLHVSDDFVIVSSELGYVVLTRSGAEISLRQREAADDNAKNESR